MQEVVTAARSSSTPVEYLKRCTSTALTIFQKILRVMWLKGLVVGQWRLAGGIWIPKEENSTKLEQF